MTRRFLLESFDEGESAQPERQDVLAQEQWLEAFEKGYKDGWEDAERTLSQRQGQVSEAFAQNLMDLSFTLNEARVAVRRDLSALLKGVLDSVLPQSLVHFLGPQILAELDALANAQAASEFEVVVAPEQKATVERAFSSVSVPSLRIVGSHDQKHDTAMIRFGRSECEVDLAAALEDVARMIETYFDEHQDAEERSYG